MNKKRLGRPQTRPDSRGEIVAGAARLFCDRGFETTSLADIAAALGFTKGAIYNYFPSKQALYDAVTLDVLTGLSAAVDAAVAGESDPALAVRAFMCAHADYFERHREAFATMLVGFGGTGDRAERAETVAVRDAYEAKLRGLIREGIEARRFRPLDEATAARAVLSQLNWMVRWFRPGGGRSAVAFALDYYDLLMAGLLQRPDPA
jgi:AcrR family transcriptional regulator